ncbi:MAG: response regulator transcription factor [Actinomycetota bacterium]|nr:response regulator transcription factor [Actinomycetota bacterium]
MHPVRVLLVDDIVLFVETLALRLAAVPDLLVVGSWSTDNLGVMFDVASLDPDVVVIDIETAGSAAGNLVAAARGGQPPGRVVVLTGSRDEQLAIAAARAGADSWVEKASSVDHLVEVIRGAVHGLSWWPPRLLGTLLAELQVEPQLDVESPALALASLSHLEREILLRFASRESQATIARELKIESGEIRSLIRSVLTKLDVTSRPEAVRFAIDVALSAASGGAPPPPYDLSSHMRRDDLSRPRLT